MISEIIPDTIKMPIVIIATESMVVINAESTTASTCWMKEIADGM